MNRKLSIQLMSLFFVLLLTACTSSKKILYLQDV